MRAYPTHVEVAPSDQPLPQRVPPQLDQVRRLIIAASQEAERLGARGPALERALVQLGDEVARLDGACPSLLCSLDDEAFASVAHSEAIAAMIAVRRQELLALERMLVFARDRALRQLERASAKLATSGIPRPAPTIPSSTS